MPVAAAMSSILPLLLAGCTASGLAGRPVVQAASEREPFVYRLRGGERLRITIDPNVHQIYDSILMVDGEGHTALPLVGEFQVVGLTILEFQEELVQRLQRLGFYGGFRNLHIEVLGLEFCVFAACYQFRDGMTVREALDAASMVHYFIDDVYISNGNVLVKGVSFDTPVHPGDIIEWPERFF